jgi:hypothetical protein
METVSHEGVIDYALPMMQATVAIKAAHSAVLEKNFEEAIEQTMVALAETKLMLNALREMKDLYR